MQTTTCLRYVCVLIAATATTHLYANDVARMNSLCAPNPNISLDCVRAHQQEFEKLFLKGEIPPSDKLEIGKKLLGLYFLQPVNSAQHIREEGLITQRMPVYRAAENAIETVSGETVSATSQATYLAEARASEAVFLSHDHSLYGPDIKYAKSQIKRYSPHKSWSLASKMLAVDAAVMGTVDGYAAANGQPPPMVTLPNNPTLLTSTSAGAASTGSSGTSTTGQASGMTQNTPVSTGLETNLTLQAGSPPNPKPYCTELTGDVHISGEWDKNFGRSIGEFDLYAQNLIGDTLTCAWKIPGVDEGRPYVYAGQNNIPGFSQHFGLGYVLGYQGRIDALSCIRTTDYMSASCIWRFYQTQ